MEVTFLGRYTWGSDPPLCEEGRPHTRRGRMSGTEDERRGGYAGGRC